MGWSASWIAIQHSDKNDILAELDLVDTGQTVQPGHRSSPFSYAELPDGWQLVFSASTDWASRNRVLTLSRFGLAVGCRFEDRIMMESSAMAARDGVELWHVFHDNSASIYRLDVSGDVPGAFSSIRDRLVEEQKQEGGDEADTDFIHDVPIELARTVCGFRHDESEVDFTGLKPARASSASSARQLRFLNSLKGLLGIKP